MNEEIYIKTLEVFQEIRDGQNQQLLKQQEALDLQAANYELVKNQFERANALQDRAETIQESAADLVANAKKSLLLVLPLIVVLLSVVAWLIFRLF
ncbi:MAG: hypothetical protein ACI9LU_000314 [Polaribacter sp.]|jgi:hypothetical protein